MGTIEKNTRDALKQHGHMLSIISMERIWDSVNGEFFKSYKQVKDFQQYLDFLTEFHIMEQILPNLKVDSKIKNQDSIVLILAQMLKNNNDKILKKKMNKIAIPGAIIDQVCFLISLFNFKAEKVLDFYKSKIRFKVSNDTMRTWFSLEKMPDHDTNKLLLFVPSVSSKTVMSDFNLKPSPELGRKIQELEIEKFKKL